MSQTNDQKALAPMDEMDLMFRGKHLLTVEQWEKFALCPDCHNRKCPACLSGPSGLTEVEQFERFHIPMMDDDSEEYIPRKLWDVAIQCCSCGSRHHIIDWLDEAIQVPEMYHIPEVEEAMLRAGKEKQESSTISVEELSYLTGWDPVTIFERASKGYIPGAVWDETLRFEKEAIEAFLIIEEILRDLVREGELSSFVNPDGE